MRKLFIALVLLVAVALVYNGVEAGDVDASTVELRIYHGGGIIQTIGHLTITADSYTNGYLVIDETDLGLDNVGHLFLQEKAVTSADKYKGGFIMDISALADTAMSLELFWPDSTTATAGEDGITEVDSVAIFQAWFSAYSR